MRAWALALALLAAAPSRAQDGPASRAADQDNPEVARERAALTGDPAALDAAVRRIERSRISGLLAPNGAVSKRRAAIRAWALRDPDSAARLALGLERDDREAGDRFERGVIEQARTYYVRNPGAQRNTYFRLKRAIAAARDVFEGGSSGAKERAAAVSVPEAYDRLSALNPRGYSPQVLLLQSALGARRPPGAPALVPTGRLDYETLFYPAYGMRWDAENLAKSRDAGRAASLARARTALAAFEAAAERARGPEGITKDLLVELGARRRDAARWIAASALEEDVAFIERREGFMSAAFMAALDQIPAPAAERTRFEKAGDALRDRAARTRGLALRALSLLYGAHWEKALAEADALAARSRAQWRKLEPEIAWYAAIPDRVASARRRNSRPELERALADFHRAMEYDRAP